MQVVVIKKENLYKYPFPNEYISTYWIKDYDDFGNERDLLAIEKVNNVWMLLSNEKCKIIDNNEEVDSASLTLNKFYLLKVLLFLFHLDQVLLDKEKFQYNYSLYHSFLF